jgi:hypothetical protein
MTRWTFIFVVSIGLHACRRAPQGVATQQDLPPGAAATGIPSALTVFDSMDTRVAVPLLPMMADHQKQNMRDHLAAVQEIVMGVAGRDFGSIERAAGRIGYSEQMGLTCNHMGAGAPGFSEQALTFHHTADQISHAAGAHDMPGVLTALSETLAACTGCHSVFKQRVVDDTTWASLTKMAPPRHP